MFGFNTSGFAGVLDSIFLVAVGALIVALPFFVIRIRNQVACLNKKDAQATAPPKQ